MKMKPTLLLFFLSMQVLRIAASPPDSLSVKFKPAALIIPSALIAYGVAGMENHLIKNFNFHIREEVNEHIDESFTVDDVSQYLPFISVYALNWAGVKGKNNFKDRTTILITAYLIMGSTVNVLKNTTHNMRPDETSTNSFPSGHTATAFMGAEFLYQEYKDVSPWYGIAGYTVAAGTGIFRMYNNRHWLTDVATGAGIGILSTKIAYWVHPYVKRVLFKNDTKISGMAVPYYNGKQMGLSMHIDF